MATRQERTPSALLQKIETIGAPELQERPRQAEAAREALDEEISALRVRMYQLSELERPVIINERSFEDFVNDPVHEDDYSWEASDQDNARLDGYNARLKNERDAAWTLSQLRDTVATQQSLMQNGTQRIEAAKQAIKAINDSLWERFKDRKGTKRAQMAEALKNLEEAVAQAPQKLEQANAALPAAMEAAQKESPEKPYDSSLNAGPSTETVRQAVLLTMSAGSRKATIEMKLPDVMDANDFTTVIQMEMDDSDAEDFAAFIGKEIPADGVWSMEDIVHYNGDIQYNLVPFTFEVVSVNDVKRLRIPQAFLDRFRSSIQN